MQNDYVNLKLFIFQDIFKDVVTKFKNVSKISYIIKYDFILGTGVFWSDSFLIYLTVIDQIRSLSYRYNRS